MPDVYEVNGKKIGSTMDDAVAWALANPVEWKRQNIWWRVEGDADDYAVIVDSDVCSEIEGRADAAKSETVILREMIVQLNRKIDVMALEASREIEALKTEVASIKSFLVL